MFTLLRLYLASAFCAVFGIVAFFGALTHPNDYGSSYFLWAGPLMSVGGAFCCYLLWWVTHRDDE